MTAAVLLAGFQLQAQQYAELEEFQRAAGGNATLFRGMEATKYNILYNGTYFWNSPAFRQGEILYDGRLYRNVYLNINASLQRVLLSSSPTSPQLELKTSDVDYITMDGVRFDNLRNQGYTDVPEGFYELLHSGKYKFYKRIDKSLRSSFETVNGQAFIGYYDPLYRNDVYDYFYCEPSFYLVDEQGTVSRIKNRSQVAKLYTGKRSELKKYLYNRFSTASPSLEEYCIAVIEFTQE